MNCLSRWGILTFAGMISLGVLGSVEAKGQSFLGQQPGSIGQTARRSSAAVGRTPGAEPGMIPYMNPAMTLAPMDRETAWLYLLSMNQARGGLGSGRLSGSRPARVTPMPEEGISISAPGGAAAGYFGRGASSNSPRHGLLQSLQKVLSS